MLTNWVARMRFFRFRLLFIFRVFRYPASGRGNQPSIPTSVEVTEFAVEDSFRASGKRSVLHSREKIRFAFQGKDPFCVPVARRCGSQTNLTPNSFGECVQDTLPKISAAYPVNYQSGQNAPNCLFSQHNSKLPAASVFRKQICSLSDRGEAITDRR